METLLQFASDFYESGAAAASAQMVAHSVVTVLVYRALPLLFWWRRAGRANPAEFVPERSGAVALEQSLTPAAGEVLSALNDGFATYDPLAHVLLCSGVMVEFASEADHAKIGRVLAAPAFQNGKWSGTDAYPLVEDHERELIDDAARSVRDAAKQRDLAHRNAKAAAAMVMARYRHNETTLLPSVHQTYPAPHKNAPGA